ncbi:hypothetical protein [uncultured Flavobacterium sp.]|jgi:hypothetical protein|uniref:hypothetical protein n=1 Tax=uncultured Flavobacterium sp. TaxID=165435 RepID=UPI00259399F1|nr:hypothetical protein [uncultured Flavobacterium sp.]
MKTFNLKIVILTSIIGFFLMSCNNSPATKEEDLKEATEDMVNAQADLEQSELDSINDFNKYKESIQLKLAENQKIIGDLKLKINSKSKAARDVDEVEINELEKRNTDLKLKIENYEQGPEQKWALFKVDFNNEMDDLGKSISNMAERNMKK